MLLAWYWLPLAIPHLLNRYLLQKEQCTRTKMLLVKLELEVCASSLWLCSPKAVKYYYKPTIQQFSVALWSFLFWFVWHACRPITRTSLPIDAKVIWKVLICFSEFISEWKFLPAPLLLHCARKAGKRTPQINWNSNLVRNFFICVNILFSQFSFYSLLFCVMFLYFFWPLLCSEIRLKLFHLARSIPGFPASISFNFTHKFSVINLSYNWKYCYECLGFRRISYFSPSRLYITLLLTLLGFWLLLGERSCVLVLIKFSCPQKFK